jgi:hypothetical protein
MHGLKMGGCWRIIASDGWESPVVDMALVRDPNGRAGLSLVYDDMMGGYGSDEK